MEVKVVLLGASGAGKTTLAKIIAEKAGIEYISNSAAGIMPIAFKDYLSTHYGWEGGKGQRAVLDKSHEDPTFGMSFQSGVLQGREKILQSQGSKILDRSPLDPWVFFLNQLSHQFPDGGAYQFRDKCFRALHNHCTCMIKVDLVNPSKTIPSEDGAGRIDHWHFQRKIDVLFNLAIDEYLIWCDEIGFLPIPYLRIPMWDLDTRVKESLGFLDAIK